MPLLTDRWPDVRWIGLSICTSLAVTEQGREQLDITGQKFVGGLWSFVFSIILDDMECGFVRQQVCFNAVHQLAFFKLFCFQRIMCLPQGHIISCILEIVMEDLGCPYLMVPLNTHINIETNSLHFRISYTDSKLRTTLYSIINSATGKNYSTAFISVIAHLVVHPQTQAPSTLIQINLKTHIMFSIHTYSVA